MFPKDTDIVRAASLADAAELLRDHGPGAELLAGGQSLVPMMKLRVAAPDVLVDISHLSAGEIRFEDDLLVLPALTTHAETVAHPRLVDTFDVVADAIPQIADPQVRNMGTVGGSLAQADPSGDWGPVVMILDGTIHTVSPDGDRAVPVDEFYEGPFATALADDEVVDRVTLPLPDSDTETGGAYLKIKRRQGVYATASVGVRVSMDGETCVEAGVAVNSVGPTYYHPTDLERQLEGEALTDERIRRASDDLVDDLDVIADTRGSEQYKRDVVRSLFKRAAKTARQRAGGEEVDADPLAQMGAI